MAMNSFFVILFYQTVKNLFSCVVDFPLLSFLTMVAR